MSPNLKRKTHSGTYRSHPHCGTCLFMPMTLQSGGTISQLMNSRGHTPSKATPSSMSAKLQDNQLSVTVRSRTNDEQA